MQGFFSLFAGGFALRVLPIVSAILSEKLRQQALRVKPRLQIDELMTGLHVALTTPSS